MGCQLTCADSIDGNVNRAGTSGATTTVKTDPVPDQAESYNLARDPLELNNLANSTIRATLRQLEAMLHAQCQAKRLKPRSARCPRAARLLRDTSVVLKFLPRPSMSRILAVPRTGMYLDFRPKPSRKQLSFGLTSSG
jgi:hypothetical protein